MNIIKKTKSIEITKSKLMHLFKRRFHATLEYDVCNGMMRRRHSTHGGKTCLYCKKSVYYPDAIKHREGIREFDVGVKETARRGTSIRCHLRIPERDLNRTCHLNL